MKTIGEIRMEEETWPKVLKFCEQFISFHRDIYDKLFTQHSHDRNLLVICFHDFLIRISWSYARFKINPHSKDFCSEKEISLNNSLSLNQTLVMQLKYGEKPQHSRSFGKCRLIGFYNREFQLLFMFAVYDKITISTFPGTLSN
jgi:hypothetical protein